MEQKEYFLTLDRMNSPELFGRLLCYFNIKFGNLRLTSMQPICFFRGVVLIWHLWRGQRKAENEIFVCPKQISRIRQQFTCSSLGQSLGCCLSWVATRAYHCWIRYSVSCASPLDPAMLIRSDRPLASSRLCTVADSPHSSWEWLRVLSLRSRSRWAAWILARHYADFEWVPSSLREGMKKRKEED